MRETIKKQIKAALERVALTPRSPASLRDEVGDTWQVELTKDFSHGDYASNVALQIAGRTGGRSLEIAEKLLPYLGNDPDGYIEKVEIAGPGFLNFWLSDKYLESAIVNCTSQIQKFGWNRELAGKKVMVEYAQPNPFKQFHIGHLMGTVIGECYARLYEAAGATVLRANYQGDIGVHVACAVWGIRETKEVMPAEGAELPEKTAFLGKAYAFGAKAYKDDPEAKKEIDEFNKKLYQRSDKDLNNIYETGKRWSLEHFDTIYKKLDTHFDYLFFESEMAPKGLEIIAAHREVFEDSQGAVVFPGEKYGLHTRVFITSQGLPTYEAKELGLNKYKFETERLDLSVVETANEINDYFKVILKVLELTLPEVAKRTKHISHGMLRLPAGKMSSRTGNVITGESLIADVEKIALEKNPDPKVAAKVAIAAIKYSILKQQPGKDIIFDFGKSLSLEGDSGPYLQYAYARARSVLEKAQVPSTKAQTSSNFQNLKMEERGKKLMRLIARWPEVLREAQDKLAPQVICTYLIEIAGEFNSFYASNQIINPNDRQTTETRLALAAALAQTLSNGLWILGIPVLEHM